MRKVFMFVLLLVALLVAACDTGATASEFKDPTVKLNHVEVQNYFAPPWAGWPGAVPTPTPNPQVITPTQYVQFPGAIAVPLVLAFVFDVTNPNDQNVMLDQLKFGVEFEAAPMKPGEYFALANPITYEKQTIPPKATNQVRVVTVLDSSIVPGNLAVTSGQRLGALGLTGAQLVQNWWTNIGDFKFGIRVNGVADFKPTTGPTKVVQFDGKFPNK